jgi:hypothetical protein
MWVATEIDVGFIFSCMWVVTKIFLGYMHVGCKRDFLVACEFYRDFLVARNLDFFSLACRLQLRFSNFMWVVNDTFPVICGLYLGFFQLHLGCN